MPLEDCLGSRISLIPAMEGTRGEGMLLPTSVPMCAFLASAAMLNVPASFVSLLPAALLVLEFLV